MSRRVTVSLLLAAAACGGPARYVNPNADLSAIQTIAVLPFENLTADRLSAERIQRILLTELLMLDAFAVVEPGQVATTVRRASVEPGSYTTDDFKKLGRELKAEALFVGTLVECEDRAGADGSKLTVQLRMVETQSGATVWSVSRNGSGATMGSRLFGFSAKSTIELAQELFREELHRFVQ